MPLSLSYKFDSSSNLKKKIDCLKEKLNLSQYELDEGKGYKLSNQDGTLRIDISSTQDEDFNLFYFLLITLTKDEYKSKIIECLGSPTYQRIKKPSIMDICDIIISKKEMSKENIIDHLKSNYGLSEKEIIDYFNKISSFSKMRRVPSQVMEAAELIK